MKQMWGKGTPWKTESTFWGWVRGGLRRAVWMKHPTKLTHLKEHRFKSPLGRGGQEVWACICVVCKETKRQSECQVDHKIPAGSLSKPEDIQGFVERLAFVSDDEIQIVCKPCHGILTYSERYGVSFEAAKKRKAEIKRKKK